MASHKYYGGRAGRELTPEGRATAAASSTASCQGFPPLETPTCQRAPGPAETRASGTECHRQQRHGSAQLITATLFLLPKSLHAHNMEDMGEEPPKRSRTPQPSRNQHVPSASCVPQCLLGTRAQCWPSFLPSLVISILPRGHSHLPHTWALHSGSLLPTGWPKRRSERCSHQLLPPGTTLLPESHLTALEAAPHVLGPSAPHRPADACLIRWRGGCCFLASCCG